MQETVYIEVVIIHSPIIIIQFTLLYHLKKIDKFWLMSTSIKCSHL